MATLADFFVPIEKYIPSALVSIENLAKCRTLTQLFPAGITRHFGFERRLNNPKSDIGFAFSILFGSPGWNFLVNLASDQLEPISPQLPFGTFAWKRIQALCAETENSTSSLYNLLLEGFWVEYDIGRIDTPLSSPDFFLPFKIKRMNISDPRSVVSQLVALVMGESSLPQIEANLIAGMNKLPPVAEINQLGMMTGRTGSIIRLVVTFPNVETAAAYIRDIGWSDDYGALASACSQFKDIGDISTLQIDFNATAELINPRIGLETRFNEPQASPERWHRLFDAYEQQGLCLPEERAALQSFPRLTCEVVTLPMAYNLGISHLKLVLYPDRAPEAKAYFGTIIDIWNTQ